MSQFVSRTYYARCVGCNDRIPEGVPCWRLEDGGYVCAACGGYSDRSPDYDDNPAPCFKDDDK